jgi:TetR/AcrR family fatty acid metabolism transcriptional regulator
MKQPGMKENAKKMNSRSRQAVETRNRIYESAHRIMEIKGFDNMTVEQISRDAGVSVGAFYHHFKSKFDILDEVFRRADDYFRDQVIDAIGEKSTPGKILSYFKHYARFNSAQGIDHIRALYKTQNVIFLNRNRFMISALCEIVSEGLEKKEIVSETMNSDEITEFLFTMARGVVYNWCIQDGSFSLEEKMSNYMSRIIRTFTPSTGYANSNGPMDS